jgi:hypothetical protein
MMVVKKRFELVMEVVENVMVVEKRLERFS